MACCLNTSSWHEMPPKRKSKAASTPLEKCNPKNCDPNCVEPKPYVAPPDGMDNLEI
uniref:Uncharacterized protein n=1 Tax=Tetranychus urticae TaxID=32264 RepID=T1JVK8_TETUR